MRLTSRLFALCACSALLAAGAIAAAAQAAVPVGQTMPGGAVPRDECHPLSGVQIASGSGGPSYEMPSAGVITSFSHMAGSEEGSIRLAVYQETLDPVEFFTVGRSAVEELTPGTLNTFATQIPVVDGDLLGLTVFEGEAVTCAFQGGTGDQLGTCVGCDPAPNQLFEVDGDELVNGDRLNISAMLEPDIDDDGYGDETQDQCPSEASTHGACGSGGGGDQPTGGGGVPTGGGKLAGGGPPPDTDDPDSKFKKHPPKKSDDARATFTFSADEQGVTFACKLDNRPYKPCSSPKTVKVREGGHKFSIVATDEAGNEGKPDMWVWKFSNFFKTKPGNNG